MPTTTPRTAAARPASPSARLPVRRGLRHRLRVGFLALLTLASVVGAVALVLHEDPASRAALVDLLGPTLDDVRARMAAVGLDVG